MSKDMHPSNWQTEAEQAYELLAEKDTRIRELEGLVDEQADEIEKLHGNLNDCTERGTEAERKMVEARRYVGDVGCWQKRAYDAEAKVRQLDNLFNIQQTRMGKATKLWQEATGKKETLPDLGDLLDWLMERGTEKDAEIERLRNRLKTTADFLKPIADRIGSSPYCWQCNGIIIEARKALAGIKGESEQNNFQKKPADEIRWGLEEPDWEWLRCAARNSEQCQAILWLKEQIATIEGTLSDVQAELIKQNNG